MYCLVLIPLHIKLVYIDEYLITFSFLTTPTHLIASRFVVRNSKGAPGLKATNKDRKQDWS
jgi:hypothetical protein